LGKKEQKKPKNQKLKNTQKNMLKPFKIMRKKKQERNRNFLNHRK
jgi:hypothetical protein